MLTIYQKEFLRGMKCVNYYLYEHAHKTKPKDSDNFRLVLLNCDSNLVIKRNEADIRLHRQNNLTGITDIAPFAISNDKKDAFLGGCLYATNIVVKLAEANSYCNTTMGKKELELFKSQLLKSLDRFCEKEIVSCQKKDTEGAI
jgi:hypothetical protein